jgi:hypothetical protein
LSIDEDCEEDALSRKLLALLFVLLMNAAGVRAADLVRLVRFKLSAGDLASGIAAVEDYRKATGVDAEYLDAVGWLARGAEMLGRPELARRYVVELRREIPDEKEGLLGPYGAAIEVWSRLMAAREGRGPAIRYLRGELDRARASSLRSRITKNINLLSLEGSPAPPLAEGNWISGPALGLDSLRGKPVLLYFWAWGCGDCKAQSVSLGRVWEKYRGTDLQLITATRLYGTVENKPATPDEERAEIEKVWKELYPGLVGVGTLISTETMERYGVSATPTFALVDREGLVRLYAPTRLSEEELSRRIEEVLAERD